MLPRNRWSERIFGAIAGLAIVIAASQPVVSGPGDGFKDCAGCPEMVVVPAGSFIMGATADEPERFADEGPRHPVTIAKAFAVGKFAITVDQFADFVNETGHDAGSKCFTWDGSKWEDAPG